ncbi:MAG: ATP-binding protein [Cyclobacteriaceae bacterium]
MENLIQKSSYLIARVAKEHQRTTIRPINWQWKLNGLIGARGTGKTTLLLQKLSELQQQGNNVLYVTLDDFYFTENKLYDLANSFYQKGGDFLFIDEVHKYPNWSRELKNIYDSVPDLKLTFSGSSILEIRHSEVDLSRRALIYELQGLSFREYLIISKKQTLPKYTLNDILASHVEIATEIISSFRPLEVFQQYIREGYYPFFTERDRDYNLTLEQVIQLVVEVDMKYMEGFDPAQSRKLLQLLRIIAASVPFKPNVSKLSERIGIHRNTLIQYLNYLQKAKLIRLMHLPEKDISVLQKPDKIYLDNPNLHFVLNPQQVNMGSIRESFLANQLDQVCDLHLHRQTDFLIDNSISIEVGGKNKGQDQIRGLENAYLVLDDIEVGYENRVPLYLFGLVY